MSFLKNFEKFSKVKETHVNRKKAIIYTRVSTKEQADNNHSLLTQMKYCNDYAEKNAFEVAGCFGGTYESAKSDERKEFKKMITYAKQNKTVGFILVYSYDRFSRTGANASYITEELNKQGIQVISVTQKVDTSNAGGIFQQNLFYLFSQFDNEMRRDKTVTGMTELLRKGYWLWTPPRGYENAKKHHRAIDWDIVVNDEGRFLKKAFEWRSRNMYSTAQIVRKLNEMGMNITENRLHEIFKNPFYCGVLISKMIPGEAIVGVHEPLISQEKFLKINTPQSKVVSKTYESMCIDLPLKKLVRCNNCGHLLTGYLNKAKGLYYYKCQKKCKGYCVSAKKLNNQFEELLMCFEIDSDYKDIIEQLLISKIKESTKDKIEANIASKSRLTKLQKDLDIVDERFATGIIDVVIYQKISSKYKSEILELEQQLSSPQLNCSTLEKGVKKAIDLSQNISKTWVSSDLFGKHKLQQTLFPEGIRYDKQQNTVLTSKMNSIFCAISYISKDLTQQKNGEPIKINQFSVGVTSLGFKPKTSTAVM